MRIAHLSDLHLLDLTGAGATRFMNKRFTGWVNLKLKRGHTHKPEPVFAAAEEVRARGVDHVVITGDVSNLALEREFDRVQDLLGRFGLGPENVSLVPGNHDAYTRGAVRSRRFQSWFAAHMTSDLSVDSLDEKGKPSAFPFVRLRGPLAIVGLSSAVARLPLIASGTLGDRQLAALGRLLDHPEVQRRTPVFLQHHPVHNPPSFAKTLAEGLLDAKALHGAIDHLRHGLLLHGHLHRRMHRILETKHGQIEAVGATSASLLDDREDRMAGFNLYDFADDGKLSAISALRYVRGGGFVETPVPRV